MEADCHTRGGATTREDTPTAHSTQAHNSTCTRGRHETKTDANRGAAVSICRAPVRLAVLVCRGRHASTGRPNLGLHNKPQHGVQSSPGMKTRLTGRRRRSSLAAAGQPMTHVKSQATGCQRPTHAKRLMLMLPKLRKSPTTTGCGSLGCPRCPDQTARYQGQVLLASHHRHHELLRVQPGQLLLLASPQP